MRKIIIFTFLCTLWIYTYKEIIHTKAKSVSATLIRVDSVFPQSITCLEYLFSTFPSCWWKVSNCSV